jgi:hypothetical protein
MQGSDHHPNIIHMLECFLAPDPRDGTISDLYIVMEHGG